jgi:hypothetical protein
MELLFSLIVFGYGVFFVFWPEKARQQFLAPFNLEAPTKWYKPNTYMKFRPPVAAFRIIGVVAICASILLYAWRYPR